MKKLKSSNRLTKITLLALMICFTAIALAQTPEKEKMFSVTLFVDPVATDKDGFNIGASVDFQMKYVYFKAQTFYFPKLRGVDYLEVSGVPLGFNVFSKHNEYRIYTGLKLGFLHREQWHAIAGLEGGVDININKNFFIGFMLSYDYREDNKIWDARAEPYWRLNGIAKLGYRF